MQFSLKHMETSFFVGDSFLSFLRGYSQHILSSAYREAIFLDILQPIL